MACSEDMTRILSIPFLGLGCVEAFPPRRHCFTGLAPLPCVLLPTRRFIAIKRSSAWPPPGTHRINKFFRLRCLTPLLPLWPLPRDTTGRSEVCVRGGGERARAAAPQPAPSRSRLCGVCVCARARVPESASRDVPHAHGLKQHTNNTRLMYGLRGACGVVCWHVHVPLALLAHQPVPAFAPGDYGTGSGRSVLCCLAWSRSAKRSSRASRACTCCSVPFVAAIRRRTLCSFCACGAKEGICDEPRNVCSSAATCEGRRWGGEGGEATAMAVDDD